MRFLAAGQQAFENGHKHREVWRQSIIISFADVEQSARAKSPAAGEI